MVYKAVDVKFDNIHASIAKTERDLSSQIDLVDSSLNECVEVSTATQEEVSELRSDVQGIGVDVKSVNHAVENLKTKINRYAVKQDLEYVGMLRLLEVAQSSQDTRTTHHIQGGTSSSSRPALQLAPVTPSRVSVFCLPRLISALLLLSHSIA